MAWNWERLSDVVRRLKLPAGEYVVGRVGYGLSRDPSSTAHHVELLVTETGWRRLKERGWRERAGGRFVQHPKETGLSAHVAVLDEVRSQIIDVDGVPVIAVEPDPPAPPPGRWRELLGTGVFGIAFTAVVIVGVYGFALLEPSPEPRTVWQHLTLETTKVEAVVEDSSELGTCQGAEVWDTSPRVKLWLSWSQDGAERTATYTACGVSADSPKNIWVTDDGEVADHRSPWWQHFWAILVCSIPPLLFFVGPLVGHLQAWLRRRRSQPPPDQVIRRL